MRLYFSCAVLLFTVSASTGFAQDVDSVAGADRRAGFQVQAIAARNFGNSRYEMKALAPDPRDPQTLVSIRSELEFPVDVTVTGARIVWQPGAGALERWKFVAELFTNLADPGNRMTDRDFVAGREVIHAESDTQLDLWQAAFDMEYLLHAGDRTSVSLLVAVQYLKIDVYAVGYEGWQKSLFSENTFDISGTEPVLDYRVTYVSPQAGAALEQRVANNIGLGLLGSAGVVFAKDSDNHIIRERTSEGYGFGLGLTAQGSLELRPGILPLKNLSARLYGGLRYYYATGTSDQTFSDGRQYLDLAYAFKNLQPQIGASLGLAF